MDKLSSIIFSKKQLSPLVSADIFACGSVFAFTPLPCFGSAIFAPWLLYLNVVCLFLCNLSALGSCKHCAQRGTELMTCCKSATNEKKEQYMLAVFLNLTSLESSTRNQTKYCNSESWKKNMGLRREKEKKLLWTDQNKLLVVWMRRETSGHVHIHLPLILSSSLLHSFCLYTQRQSQIDTHAFGWVAAGCGVIPRQWLSIVSHFSLQSVCGKTSNYEGNAAKAYKETHSRSCRHLPK